RQVHEAARAWATADASRRVDHAVAEAAESRLRMSALREDILTGVLDLGRVRAASQAVAAGPSGSPDRVACPYRGLAAFEAADAELFHGRERLVAELVARLVQGRLLAVVGGSGSGKSSLVRAGLLPALASGVLPGSAGWRQLVLTPA